MKRTSRDRGTWVGLILLLVAMGLSPLVSEAIYSPSGQESHQPNLGGAGCVGVGETIKVYAKFDLTLITLEPTITIEVAYPDHSPQWAPWRFELLPAGGLIEWEDIYGIGYTAWISPPDDRGVITATAPEVVVEQFLGNLTRNPGVWADSAAYLAHEAGLGVGFATDPATGEVGFYAGRVGSAEGYYHLIGPAVKLVVGVPHRSYQRLTFTITDEVRQELGFRPWGGETVYVVTFYEVWSPPLAEPKVKPQPPGLVN